MNTLFKIGDDVVCVDEHSAYMNRPVKVRDITICGHITVYTVGFPTRIRCHKTGKLSIKIPSEVTTFAVRENNLKNIGD